MDVRHAPSARTNLELLERSFEMALDNRRRLRATCGITLAVTDDGQTLFVGSEVPDAVVPALVAAVDSSPRGPAPDVEPPALAACRALLEPTCAPLAVHSGPYYMFGPDAGVDAVTPIARSDRPTIEPLRTLNPGNWGADEWAALLDGSLGPWAMAVVDGAVVSICHTPRRMTEHAAECGVWTHPEYRGRGYAAEVAAAWSEILRPSGRQLYYSTDADNLSSRRVAARLGLRPIGWTWSLRTAEPEPQQPRHPLNRRGR